MRAPAPKGDGKYFTRTASRAKAINLGFRIMRGGIRF